jgi:hypothetical protein
VRRVVLRVRVLCSSSVRETSGGGFSASLSCSSSPESLASSSGLGVICFVDVWSWTGDERIRDRRVAESGREDDVAETGRKVGEGGVVCRVGVGDVLYVGAGYVEEGRVVSDRER